MPRFQAEALQRGVTDCSLDFLGFSWDIQQDDGGTSLWIYAQESGSWSSFKTRCWAKKSHMLCPLLTSRAGIWNICAPS